MGDYAMMNQTHDRNEYSKEYLTLTGFIKAGKLM